MSLPNLYGLVRFAAPAAEPLTLSETKQFLRVSHADDDTRINDMMISARLLAEQWLKRSLVTQSWKLTYEDELPCYVPLPMGPVQSITSITSISATGSSTIIPASSYALSADKSRLLLSAAISGHRVEIVYVAGYGTASQLPRPIKLGLLQHIAAMYDGQIELAPIPDAVLQYYMPFRELRL